MKRTIFKKTEFLSISAEQFIDENSRSDGFLMINKKFLSAFGLVGAGVLGNLIEKSKLFKRKFKNNNGWFFNSHKNQANHLGISLYQIKMIKKEFIESGILISKIKGMPAKEWLKIDYVKIYKIAFCSVAIPRTQDPSDSDTQDPSDSDTQDPSDSDTHIYKNRIKKNKDISNDTSSLATTAKKININQFDDFWNIYPRKSSKGASTIAWEKICILPLKRRPTFSEIEDAINSQKKSKQWQDPKYIPHASTWLNSRRWLNDPEEMKAYSDKKQNGTGYSSKIEYKSYITR